MDVKGILFEMVVLVQVPLMLVAVVEAIASTIEAENDDAAEPEETNGGGGGGWNFLAKGPKR
jgi:hypothetical protein